MAEKVKVIIIDQDRNSVEIDMDLYLYKSLGIRGSNIKKHKRRVDLNKSVTEFLNRN